MKKYIMSTVAALAMMCGLAKAQTTALLPNNQVPIAVWWQQANETGHSGPYATLAAAAAAAHMNIFLGQGSDWPEQFGSDEGELEAVKQNDLYMVGGVAVSPTNDTSAQSVASILALANSIGATSNLIGYNAGDEPSCEPSSGQLAMSSVPSTIAGIKSFDPTRFVFLNFADWFDQPQWQNNPNGCLVWDTTAAVAPSVVSMDLYPMINPHVYTAVGVTGTDWMSIPNDALWTQGLSVQNMVHYAAPGQPVLAYIESGSDAFGASEVNNYFTAYTTAGSNVVAVQGSTPKITTAWLNVGISGSGIPSGTQVKSIINGQAILSANATKTGSTTLTVVGGSGWVNDCNTSTNFCIVNGNEQRATPEQVTNEVWMSFINGANGIEWFCHDSLSYSFCLDDTAAGGQAAADAFANITYVDSRIDSLAKVLNSSTVALCSMDSQNYTTGVVTTTSECGNSNLQLSTNNASAAALVKSYNGQDYVFVQTSRLGSSVLSVTLPFAANKTATVVYDSYHRFHTPLNELHSIFSLDANGKFSDSFGTAGTYQTKIYRIN